MSKNKYEKQKYGMEKASPRMLTPEELSFIEGRTAPKPIARDDEEVTLDEGDKVTPMPGGGFEQYRAEQPQTFNMQQVPVLQDVQYSDNTIVIDDADKQVELRFETSVPRPDGTSKSVVFSVSIGNSSIDISEDGISILTRSDIDIKPPTLVPLTIIVDSGKQYDVVYAGGKHRFGKFTNISFARIDV